MFYMLIILFLISQKKKKSSSYKQFNNLDARIHKKNQYENVKKLRNMKIVHGCFQRLKETK